MGLGIRNLIFSLDLVLRTLGSINGYNSGFFDLLNIRQVSCLHALCFKEHNLALMCKSSIVSCGYLEKMVFRALFCSLWSLFVRAIGTRELIR